MWSSFSSRSSTNSWVSSVVIAPWLEGSITTEDTGEFVDDLDGKIDHIIEKLEGMKIEDAAEIET